MAEPAAPVAATSEEKASIDFNNLDSRVKDALYARLAFNIQKLAYKGIYVYNVPESKRHLMFPPSDSSSSSASSSKEQPPSDPPAGSVTCTVCQKHYSTQGSLKTHIRTCHTEKKPYKCDYCGKQFALKNYLNVHERTHTGEKPFTCCLCYNSYSTKSSLNTHMKTQHSTERPYKCADCDKAFALKSYLVAHQRHHTGIKPYPCELCFSHFVSKSSLNTHAKMFHAE